MDVKGVELHELTSPIPGGSLRYIKSLFYFRPPPEGTSVTTEEDNQMMNDAKSLKHIRTHLPKNKYGPFCVVGNMVKDNCRSQCLTYKTSHSEPT